jgi:ACS family hexuronate transporter-like MFS transporter
MKKPINNLRWWIAGLVFLSTVINYVDRQTLSVLAPRLTKELHLSNTQYGWISQAFLVPYTAMFIVAGLLIDRYGTKVVYGVAAAWWSIAAMLHAAVSSAFGFGAARFLLGTAESANFVGAQKVAAEWFPPKDRGTLNGLVQAGTVTGAVITPPVVIWMADRWGWRTAFLFTGALGLVWVIAWMWLYHLPERHPRISAEELALISDAEPERQGDNGTQSPSLHPIAPPSPKWIDFFRFPQTWGLLLARIISDPVWWFYLFWLPKYLTEQEGLTEKRMSVVVWIPYLVSDIGSIAGGWYSGKLIARKLGAVASRKSVMMVSALMMPLGILLVFRPPTVLAMALISFVLGMHSCWKTNLATLTVDIFPRRVVASVHGIVATGGGIGGALFTTFAGYIIDKYSYTPLLVLMGVLHPLAYLCVRRLVPNETVQIGELKHPVERIDKETSAVQG